MPTLFSHGQLESGTGLRFGNTAVVSVSVDNQSKSKVDGIRATLIHDMYFSASAFEERVQIVMAKTPKICCKKTDRYILATDTAKLSCAYVRACTVPLGMPVFLNSGFSSRARRALPH